MAQGHPGRTGCQANGLSVGLQALHGPQLPQPVFADARACQFAAPAFDIPNRFEKNIICDTTLARAVIGIQRHVAYSAARTTMR
jgi:hypothetical protein